MQAETQYIGAAGFTFASVIFRLNLKSYVCNSIPGAGTGGDSTLHRSALQFGEQRLAPEQRVRFLRIRLRAQAAPFKQSDNLLGNALQIAEVIIR
jgi:hypothetical protein